MYNENALYKYFKITNRHTSKMNFILLVFIFIGLIQNNAENMYNLRLRNTLLRIYIASDKKELVNEYSKRVVIKSKNIVNKYYHKLLSKLYDINLLYNNLTDEERDFIDFIISLCY